MALIPDPTSQLIEHVLRFRNHRQDVIAANIANANTPGYRGFDVVLDQKLQATQGAALRRTDPRHIAGPALSPDVGAKLSPSNERPRLDGNNVSVEQEFVKLMENRTMYVTAFELRDKLGGFARVARETR